MKNLKFKASQFLIMSSKSNWILNLAVIFINQTNETTAFDNNKFTNLSENFWKCLS